MYRSVPGEHALATVVVGDRRKQLAAAALGQDWMTRAPVLLLIAGSTGFLFWHRTNLYPLGPDASEIVRLVLVLACAAIPSYWLATFVRGRGE